MGMEAEHEEMRERERGMNKFSVGFNDFPQLSRWWFRLLFDFQFFCHWAAVDVCLSFPVRLTAPMSNNPHRSNIAKNQFFGSSYKAACSISVLTVLCCVSFLADFFLFFSILEINLQNWNKKKKMKINTRRLSVKREPCSSSRAGRGKHQRQ